MDLITISPPCLLKVTSVCQAQTLPPSAPLLPLCEEVSVLYSDFPEAGPQPPNWRLLTSPVVFGNAPCLSLILTFPMFCPLCSALVDLLSGSFPESLIMIIKLAFGGCRIQMWSHVPSLVFVATNEPCIWHLCHSPEAGEQWLKCQQQRIYRSTMCTVIGKIECDRLSVVEAQHFFDVAVSYYL